MRLFLLDTGAANSAIDVSLKSSQWKSKGIARLRTPAGIHEVETFAWPDAAMGEHKLKTNRPVSGLDLMPIRHASGEEIYGVIGMDVLRSYRVQIDFDRGSLRLLKSLPVESEELGEPVPMEFTDDGCPCIPILVGDKTRERIQIDTGAHASALESELFDRLAEQKLIRRGAPFASVTASGELRGDAGRLGVLSLGPFKHKNLRFERVNASAFGLRYLSRYRITLDFPGQAAYFKPGARFNEPDPAATSGMTLVRIDGKTLINSVMNGGPAGAAGLKPNDEILKINGKNIADYDFFAIRQALTSQIGRKVQISIRRGTTAMDLIVILADNQQ